MRLVTETDRFMVMEPYAPRFPFETWILPKRHESHFEDSDAPTLQNLAWVLRSTMRKIDRVLEHPAYNFMMHSAPVQDARAAVLPLAHRDHPQADEGGGLRMGHGILHQSHAARRVAPALPAGAPELRPACTFGRLRRWSGSDINTSRRGFAEGGLVLLWPRRRNE